MVGSGAVDTVGLRLALAGRKCVLPGDGDTRGRKQEKGKGCEYDGAMHAGSCLRVTARGGCSSCTIKNYIRVSRG